MKSYRLISISCLALMCSVLGLAQTAAPTKSLSPAEQTLMAREKGLIEAIKKDDEEFFERALTADFSLVAIDGQFSEGRPAMDELGNSNLVEFTPYDMKIKVDDTTAVVSYDAILREVAQEDQGPPPRYQHLSSVWVKQSGQWKLKFHQATAAHWGDW